MQNNITIKTNQVSDVSSPDYHLTPSLLNSTTCIMGHGKVQLGVPDN
jgi:hypothetical protein